MRSTFDPDRDAYAMFGGGSWNSGALYARCTSNGRYGHRTQIGSLGFRLVR